MNNRYNHTRPLIMHIDLNSCFASIEQQSRPLLRNRPVAVVNRRTKHTAIVTASYEAKAFGAKVGMRLTEAERLVPGLIAVESDPPKYRYVYHKLMNIMKDYSAHIVMKSIDEGVIDFTQTTLAIQNRALEDVGMEIKSRLKSEVGRAMRCNVGIGTNRFLAKTAAGLHKPDGLDVITGENLRDVFSTMKLVDLTGIASRNEHRLNMVGIYTPLEFLDADVATLEKIVFKSVNGKYWHQRLRGWEVDDIVHDTKTVGRQYVLESRDLTREQIYKRLHNLCESVGGRLRTQGKAARGVFVYVRTKNRGYWHMRHMSPLPFFSDQAIYGQALRLLMNAPDEIIEIGVTCYQLSDGLSDQLSLFGDAIAREQLITSAVDTINRRFGERTIHAADTLGTDGHVKVKVPFGSTRYL